VLVSNLINHRRPLGRTNRHEALKDRILNRIVANILRFFARYHVVSPLCIRGSKCRTPSPAYKGRPTYSYRRGTQDCGGKFPACMFLFYRDDSGRARA